MTKVIESVSHELKNCLQEKTTSKENIIFNSSVYIDFERAKEFLEKNELFLFVDKISIDIFCSKSVINWCDRLLRVYPITTPGDGNCLCNALMISFSGLTDNSMIIYNELMEYISMDECRCKLIERFKASLLKIEANLDISSLDLTKTATIDSENKIKIVSRDEMTLGSIHIFALANMFKRPIIVIDPNQEKKNCETMHGIYLPVFNSPDTCCQFPVLLAHSNDRFMPLLPAKLGNNYYSMLEKKEVTKWFPICDEKFNFPPLKYLIEEECCELDIIFKYIKIQLINVNGKGYPCTVMTESGSVNLLNSYFDFYIDAVKEMSKSTQLSNLSAMTLCSSLSESLLEKRVNDM